MYRYDEFDHRFVMERTKEFAGQVTRRLSGELSEEQFRPLRLMNGVYLQLHAYMLRIAIPYGSLDSKKLDTLAFIAENPVSHCIVHKVDRLARNRVDDVEINLALSQAGATLVSCSENIDETPSGILLHGIMSSIAEFYSRNLANEVNKGLVQKAKNGGTPFRPPIGYLPVRVWENGREIRIVGVDEERAPLVKRAFELYATGEWTTRTLLKEMTEKGLLSRPTPKRPSQPITVSAFHNMLRNPYYVGVIEYRGVRSRGNHPVFVEQAVFDEVQGVLEAQNYAGEKRRSHHHYLKGSIWCGCCSSRLIVCRAKGRNGVVYPYFICIGRQRDPGSCTQRALNIDRVVDAIENYYAHVQLSEDLQLQTEQVLLEQVVALRETNVGDRQRLVTRQRRLLDERAKLLEAHYADAVPLDLLKMEQERIATELDTIEQRLATTELKFDTVEQRVKQMILPQAIDPQIATRQSFALEARSLEQPDRRRVVREARRLQPVQLQRIEYKRNNRADRRGHVSAIGVFRPDPIAERARLGHAAAHVAEREPTDQSAGRDRKDKERIADILAKVAQIVTNASAKGGALQFVRRPERLPGRQEFPALGPELGPSGIV